MEEVDPVHAQPAQAHLGLAAQMGGTVDRHPCAGPGLHLAHLRRDEQAVGVRVQSLAQDVLETPKPKASAVSM
ncbi:hypothetical protein OG894_01660 [Streptomyces sp. NBC_01724]|nr:hypothetical protein [Streptomyces sp. NBC_01724]WTE56504.1 hypothetical protein OG987_41005 [Streptomyces sp. NBC_01620]WTE64575.1 hypothetical protein OG784_40735 [Streptomyces sp. NBC_01617]WTI91863.1 hypothetical protein OHB17_40045 [Streptomyces sp. NBC_00724]